MAIPPWPLDFPYAPDLNTVQPLTRLLDPIKTEMDGGNIRLRSRPGDNVGQISYSIPMTNAQIASFNSWVKTTLNNGTSRFSVPVWADNSFVAKTCQFSAVPKTGRLSSGKVGVAVSLRVYDI